MSSGSYAASATTYGQNPNDSFYELGRPGVYVGPLEIDGNLTVDGTTTLVGAVTAQSGLTSTGGLFSGPPGLPLTFGVDTAGNVSATTFNGLSRLGVSSFIDNTIGTPTYTWTGTQIVALDGNQIVTLNLPADVLTNTSYPQGLLFTRLQPGSQGGSTLINAGPTQIYNISPGVAPLILSVYLGTSSSTGGRQVYYSLLNNGGGIAIVNGFQ